MTGETFFPENTQLSEINEHADWASGLGTMG